MDYEKTIWTNREVEKPRTFEVVDNPDGTITLVPAEGNIVEQGTPLIAQNMNNIEQGIEDVTVTLGEHKADYEYQVPVIVGRQIRLIKQSNTSILKFKLDSDIVEGTQLNISIDGGSTSLPLQDFEGELITELKKGFVEVVADATFFTLRPSGGDYNIGDFVSYSNVESTHTEPTPIYVGSVTNIIAMKHDKFGYLYIADMYSVRKLDSDNDIVWTYTISGSYIQCMDINEDGVVVIGLQSGEVEKIDFDGQRLWSYIGHTGRANAVAISKAGLIYVSGGSSANNNLGREIRCLTTNGVLSWNTPANTQYGATTNAMALGSGGLYLAVNNLNISEVKLNGSRGWVYNHNNYEDEPNQISVSKANQISTVHKKGSALKLSHTGGLIWATYHIVGPEKYIFSLTKGKYGDIFVGTLDGVLAKINNEGSVVWSIENFGGDIRAISFFDNELHIYRLNNDVSKLEDGLKII